MNVVLAVCSIVIAALSFALSVYLYFANRAQKRIDNLVTLQTFLHKDELSEARRCVREGLCATSLQDPNVRRVLSSFDFAGTLVRHGAVDKKLFIDYWSTPLISIELPLASLAQLDTGKGTSIRQYYKDFWWLVDEAKATRHAQR